MEIGLGNGKKQATGTAEPALAAVGGRKGRRRQQRFEFYDLNCYRLNRLISCQSY